jgi:hypothetical protein
MTPELPILVCPSTRIASLLGSAASAETLQPGSNPGTRLREPRLGQRPSHSPPSEVHRSVTPQDSVSEAPAGAHLDFYDPVGQ